MFPDKIWEVMQNSVYKKINIRQVDVLQEHVVEQREWLDLSSTLPPRSDAVD